MAPKLFITGATGYVGGDALVEITNAHPDWEITLLVRDKEKAKRVIAEFPRARIVHGDLNSFALIEEESAKADIIYHFASSDDEGGAKAIAAGLARRQSERPGFLIHTSGTGILLWKPYREGRFGEDDPKVYNDWEGLDELTNLPDEAVHRNVDKIVLAASAANPDKIKTAIVTPPTIYGEGRGPGNQHSIQINFATRSFIQQKQAFSVGESQNVWHSIHIRDLSKLYLLLGEAAANGGEPASWNDQGYYLAENGNYVWKDVFQAIAQEAHKRGWLPSASVEPRNPTDVDTNFKLFVGLTSRGVSKRASTLLGWKPTNPSIFEEIPQEVEYEAKLLGLH